MNRSFVVSALLALAVAPALAGCGEGGSARADAMESTADEFAVPAYDEVARLAGELDAAVGSACTRAASADLAAVRPVVDETRTAWYESEAVWIGPVMDRRSPAVVDWPINEPEIAELLAESQPGELTAEYLGRSVGADNRGLAAIDWVASSPPELDGVDPVVRCEYVAGLAEVIVTELGLIGGDWSESFDGGAPYADLLAGDGPGGVDEQINMLVNDTLGTLESMKDVADVPPPAVQAARLAGIRTLYAGDGDQFDGLSPLLGDELTERLTGELDAAIAAYEGEDAAAGAAAATDVQRTVATEVIAALGVTVGFSDADGDGGG